MEGLWLTTDSSCIWCNFFSRVSFWSSSSFIFWNNKSDQVLKTENLLTAKRRQLILGNEYFFSNKWRFSGSATRCWCFQHIAKDDLMGIDISWKLHATEKIADKNTQDLVLQWRSEKNKQINKQTWASTIVSICPFNNPFSFTSSSIFCRQNKHGDNFHPVVKLIIVVSRAYWASEKAW